MKKIVLAKKRRLSNLLEHNNDEPVDNPHPAAVSGNEPANTARVENISSGDVTSNNATKINEPTIPENRKPLNMSGKRPYRRKSKTNVVNPSPEFCNIQPRPIFHNPNNPLEYSLVPHFVTQPWNYYPNGPQFPMPSNALHVQYPNQLGDENLAGWYQNAFIAHRNKSLNNQGFVNPNLLPNAMQRPVDNAPIDMRSAYLNQSYRAPQESGYAQSRSDGQVTGLYSTNNNDSSSLERNMQATPRSNTYIHVPNDTLRNGSGTNSTLSTSVNNRFNSASNSMMNEHLGNVHNNHGHNPVVSQTDPRLINNNRLMNDMSRNVTALNNNDSSNHVTPANKNIIFSSNFEAPNFQKNLRYNFQDNRLVSRSGGSSNNSTQVSFSIPNNNIPRLALPVDPRITLPGYNDRQIIHEHSPLDSQTAASHDDSSRYVPSNYKK